MSEPKTINLNEITEKLSKIEQALSKMTPPEKPTALTESTKPTATEFDYKKKMVEMLKKVDATGAFKWSGENPTEERKLFESIGALSAGSAVPEIWAKDVFRCCPYPASAFYGAPYIAWHDDIKGNLA